MYYTQAKLYHDIIYWAIGINITWQWRHNNFNSKSNFCAFRQFIWKCFTVPILWELVFCCAKFHKNLFEEFPDNLEFLQKGINYPWTEDWTSCRQFCYLSEVFEKFLSLIRFANDLYTLCNQLTQVDLRDFEKTWKNVKNQ